MLNPSKSEQANRDRETAVQTLVTSNLRLVVTLCKPYLLPGVALADLVQEGNIGLLVAASRFDSRRSKFSTYASWWVRQRILRFLTNFARIVRLPAHALGQIRRLRAAISAIEYETGYTPDAAELADEIGMTERRCKTLIEAMDGSTVSVDASNEHREDYDGDHCALNLAEILDSHAPDPCSYVEREEQLNVASEAFASLLPLHREILSRRFGLNGAKKETLEQIGASKGVTRERIRQIETKAMRILRTRIIQRSDQPVL